MLLYLKRGKSGVDATGEYDPQTKKLVVLKGSRVSDSIAYSEKFRGAKTIEKNRANVVTNGIVQRDIEFKSSSTAANFVTGSSSNGLTVWKDGKGRKLKDLISAEVEQ